MNTIAIDTSNQVLGIAITKENRLVAELTTNINKDHSSRLMPAIVDMLDKVDMKPEHLHKIVVAHGPGSYTGTRIGVTTAKTMAWSLQIPIYTISSLKTLAYNGVHFNGYICPFFDARRQTVFTSLYYSNGEALTEVEAECNVPMENHLAKLAKLNEKILFLSPHLEVFQEMIISNCTTNAIIPNPSFHIPKPSNLISLSENLDHSNIHTVQPNYLRITEAEANWLKQQKDGNVDGRV